MTDRTGIFIAYCFPEKKWFDRVQAALKPILGNETIVSWDERRLQAGELWKSELAEVLASRRLAIMIVSDIFLESDFIRTAKLPALLEAGRESGLKFCWVLASHCLHEHARLNPADAAHDLNFALDGLGLEKREAELGAIAHRVAQLLGQAAPVQPLLPEPAPPDLHTLDVAMSTRHETILLLLRLARWLLLAALGFGVLSLPAVMLGLTHFLLLAGFACFLASQSLLLRARADFLGQGLLGLRYTRSGLADENLPVRQREPLVRKVEEIAG